MIKEKIYPNGLRLVVDKNKRSRVVSAGIMVNIGSVIEEPHEYGLAHLMEHVMFKSTTTRHYKEVSKLLEGLGIKYNAFTSKQCTYYHFDCILDSLRDGFDLFADMFFNGLFDAEEIETEKQVVLEEMNMSEDYSEDILMHNLMLNMYDGKINAHPVLGDRSVIESATPATLRAFKDKYYTAENMVVVVVGDVDFDTVDKYVSELFASHYDYIATPIPRLDVAIEPSIKTQYLTVEKDEKQVSLGIIIRAPRLKDRLHYALGLYTHILGNGRCSRLFDRVRERDGLCYAITAYNLSSILSGSLVIDVSVAPEKLAQALDDIQEEIYGMVDTVTEEELKRIKTSIKTMFIFMSERNGIVARSSANDIYDYGKVLTLAHESKKIDNVTLAEVNAVAKNIAKETKFVVCAVGKDVDVSILKNHFKLG